VICSPYTSPIATLYIGTSRQAYYIPKDLLQRPEWMKYSPGWIKPNMRLHSVDEDTGHVLVHYLCTGTYQTLDNMNASTDNNGRVEFKRAVMAYFAARTYELDGLQQLAMENIERCGMEMTTLDIVDLVNQEFSDIVDKTGWFYDYLKEKAKKTFQDECTSFAEGDILDRITDVKLLKMLAKCVVELYTTMVRDKADCIQTASEMIVCTINHGPSGEAPVKELPLDDFYAEEVHDIPAAELTTENCVAEEFVTAGSAKKDDSMNDNPWDFTNKKAKKDSYGSGFDAFNHPIQISDLAVTAVETKPVEDDNWYIGLGLKSKSKTNTKKRSGAITEELMIESKPESMPESTKNTDDRSVCTFGSAEGKKKKKKKGAAATLNEERSPHPLKLEPEPVSELVKEKNSCEWGALANVGGTKKKKGKKMATAETTEEPKLEEIPPPPAKLETFPRPAPMDSSDSVVPPAATGKKKKSKKGAIAVTREEPKAEEPPPLPPTEPEPFPQPALIYGWDSFVPHATTSKKKKIEKAASAETMEEPRIEETPPPSPADPKSEHLPPLAIAEIKEEPELRRKKSKQVLVEGYPSPPPPEPNPEPEPAPFAEDTPLDHGWGTDTDDDWGSAAAVTPVKKGSIMAAIPDPPEQEPFVEVAIPEPIVEAELDDSWGSIDFLFTNITNKSKENKKGFVEEPSLPPPPPGSNEVADNLIQISTAEDAEPVLQTNHLDCPASPMSEFIYLESDVESTHIPCEEYILAQSEDTTMEPFNTRMTGMDMR
jgi:hypothetical protein